MLDFRIDTFLCVCKHLNYTKAAAELCITQPAVSQHIKFLENYYGQHLFTYDNRQLKLTEAGTALKDAMLSMRHDALHLKNYVLEGPHGRKNLNFGATLSIGEFLLPDRLAFFLSNSPSTQVHFKLANTSSLLACLDEGIIDFAFVEGNFAKDAYDYITLKKDPFIAVCGADYPLPPVSGLTELFGCTLLVREEGSGTREILENFLVQSGYRLESFIAVHELNSPQIILNLLKRGCGISFLYRTVVEQELAQGTVREISVPDFNICHELNFIWRKNSIYRDFYKHILEELQLYPPLS